MPSLYLDSSALVKLYVSESGSEWVRELVASTPADQMFVSRVAVVEVASALARRVREGTLGAEEEIGLREDLSARMDAGLRCVEVLPGLAEEAAELCRRHPLRAYDAVHLASALFVARVFGDENSDAPQFLGADVRLLEAAAAEGFRTEDPNLH